MRRVLRTFRRERRAEKMTLRILDREEHIRTRSLWEEVFPEDTKAFLDYYYYIKTRDNQIYVIEEDEEICSMLQFNPYTIKVEEKEFPSAYIIAVATKEKYRRRGYMGALLRASLNEMYSRKIPFTFLMPAAEAIYTPYDFRYIYSQSRGTVPTGEQGGSAGEGIDLSDAGLWHADEMASFFEEHFAKRYQVCTVRDSAYYQTMIMEQQSEQGGVRLIRENGELKGMYAYAREDGLEVREPLLLSGYERAFRHSLEELEKSVNGQERKAIAIHACPPEYAAEKKPLIMARIVCLAELLSALKVPEEISVDCSFAVIDTIITQNSRVWKVTSEKGETELHVRETEDSEGVLPVAELAEVLFGRCAVEEVKTRDGVIMTPELERELAKITALTEVFLNEVV